MKAVLKWKCYKIKVTWNVKPILREKPIRAVGFMPVKK